LKSTGDVDFTVAIDRTKLPELYESVVQLGYADVHDVLFTQVELTYMVHWAEQLGVIDKLNQVLADLDGI
jgi:hypothetical protein